jgi:uncharacterized LabA/DUF88 family protein
MRAAAFIEIPNLFHALKKKGGRLDYGKLITKLRSEYELVNAIAYGNQIANEAVGFIGALRHLGYEPKFRRDGYYWPVAIAIDIVQIAQRVDAVILVSSNPNLAPALEWVREKGLRCFVIGCNIHRDLKHASTAFEEIPSDFILVSDETLQRTSPSSDTGHNV